MAAMQWLNRTGQISDDKRQEFILASDVLGLSMLVVQMNHRFDPAATPATVLGPFHIAGSPELEFGADMSDGVPGTPLYVHGTVRDLDGKPIAGARARRLAGRSGRRLRGPARRGRGPAAGQVHRPPGRHATACARWPRRATPSRWTGRSATSSGAPRSATSGRRTCTSCSPRPATAADHPPVPGGGPVPGQRRGVRHQGRAGGGLHRARSGTHPGRRRSTESRGWRPATTSCCSPPADRGAAVEHRGGATHDPEDEMRILIVNVNTTESMTEGIGERARERWPPRAPRSSALTPHFGAESVEGNFESYLAAVAVMDRVLRDPGRTSGEPGRRGAHSRLGLQSARRAGRGHHRGGGVDRDVPRPQVLGGDHAGPGGAADRGPAEAGRAGRPVRLGAGQRDGGAGAGVRPRAGRWRPSWTQAGRRGDRGRRRDHRRAAAGWPSWRRRCGSRTGVPVVDGVAAAVTIAESLVGAHLRPTPPQADHRLPPPLTARSRTTRVRAHKYQLVRGQQSCAHCGGTGGGRRGPRPAPPRGRSASPATGPGRGPSVGVPDARRRARRRCGRRSCARRAARAAGSARCGHSVGLVVLEVDAGRRRGSRAGGGDGRRIPLQADVHAHRRFPGRRAARARIQAVPRLGLEGDQTFRACARPRPETRWVAQPQSVSACA